MDAVCSDFCLGKDGLVDPLDLLLHCVFSSCGWPDDEHVATALSDLQSKFDGKLAAAQAADSEDVVSFVTALTAKCEGVGEQQVGCLVGAMRAFSGDELSWGTVLSYFCLRGSVEATVRAVFPVYANTDPRTFAELEQLVRLSPILKS